MLILGSPPQRAQRKAWRQSTFTLTCLNLRGEAVGREAPGLQTGPLHRVKEERAPADQGLTPYELLRCELGAF